MAGDATTDGRSPERWWHTAAAAAGAASILVGPLLMGLPFIVAAASVAGWGSPLSAASVGWGVASFVAGVGVTYLAFRAAVVADAPSASEPATDAFAEYVDVLEDEGEAAAFVHCWRMILYPAVLECATDHNDE